MIATLKNDYQVHLRFLQKEDEKMLLAYFNGLSKDTRKRFGPHPFDPATVRQICDNLPTDDTQRYIAETLDEKQIVAYMLIKNGALLKDANRLSAYGIAVSGNDCTFAPSIADSYQSSGLGSIMFGYILGNLPTKRIILWGGVQATNERALSYYSKFGFKKVGMFRDHNGENIDMIREPSQNT